MLIANMLHSLEGSSKLMAKIKYQRKSRKKKTLITKKEMWKRTGIAHSALLPSKEEYLLYLRKS